MSKNRQKHQIMFYNNRRLQISILFIYLRKNSLLASHMKQLASN
jgi:hypothetical protein